MKKIIAMCAACVIGAAAMSEEITNVYDLKVSIKAPTLKNGIREYRNQTIEGQMFIRYNDGEMVEVWAETKNRSTKIFHETVFDGEGFYHLMGKANKYSDRTVPTVYLSGADICTDDGHEFIKSICLAGNGVLKTVKTVATGCSFCGEPTKTTTYCNILYSASGNVTGIMDCQCPDDEDDWWHTVKTTLCGVWYGEDVSVERTHDASFWGTWSAKFNSKLSDTQIK